MRPYHPANLRAQPYAHWRVIALAWAGKILGIQFKIDGVPYGASYRPELWTAARTGMGSGSLGRQIGNPLHPGSHP